MKGRLAQDPAQQSIAWAAAGRGGRCAQRRSWDERARNEAQRALTLDPNLAEAHEALAAVSRSSEFNWELVINESRRALELNPSLQMPHYYLAVASTTWGCWMMSKSNCGVNPMNRAVCESGEGRRYSAASSGNRSNS
jgi:hypothetical protein